MNIIRHGLGLGLAAMIGVNLIVSMHAEEPALTEVSLKGDKTAIQYYTPVKHTAISNNTHYLPNDKTIHQNNSQVCSYQTSRQLTDANLKNATLLIDQCKSDNQTTIQAFESRLYKYGYDEVAALMASKIKAEVKPETALSYLLDHPDVGGDVRNMMSGIIANATDDRLVIAHKIKDKFLIANDEGKKILLMIATPEALLLLHEIDQDNHDIVESLAASSSIYTIDVFSKMFSNAQTDEEKNQAFEMAQTWSYQQLSGSRLDYIEQKITQSHNIIEKKFLAEILQHAEDQNKAKEILSRLPPEIFSPAS